MFAFPISQASVLRKARVGSEYKIRVGGGDDSEEYTQLQFSSKKKKKLFAQTTNHLQIICYPSTILYELKSDTSQLPQTQTLVWPAAAASCEEQPRALPDGHSVTALLQRGWGQAGLGEAICKGLSICHSVFRGVWSCCSLPVIFGFLPLGPVTLCCGYVAMLVHHKHPHNYPPVCSFLYPFKETTH